MIYFDNAATTFPKPESVYQTVDYALRNRSSNPGRSGHKMALKTAEVVYRCRRKAAEFFHADSEEQVVFSLNCTMAINLVLKGLLQHGDHVVVSGLEHNAVARPVETLRQRGVIHYSVAQVTVGETEQTVEAFRRCIRPQTRLIACTHASNVFGIKLPIRQIGELCRERGILFLVDAAQTAGISPIDMQICNIDFLCIAPHKGLYAPMGTGILIVRRPEYLQTILEGGTGSSSLELQQPNFLPDMLESGTVNVPGIAGILSGLQWIEKRGMKNITEHEYRIIRKIYAELAAIPGVILYTAMPQEHTHVPLLSFNIRGQDSEETVRQLDQMGFALRGGLHCAPFAHLSFGTEEIGTARICPSYFTTKEEATALCRAIQHVSQNNRRR